MTGSHWQICWRISQLDHLHACHYHTSFASQGSLTYVSIPQYQEIGLCCCTQTAYESKKSIILLRSYCTRHLNMLLIQTVTVYQKWHSLDHTFLILIITILDKISYDLCWRASHHYFWLCGTSCLSSVKATIVTMYIWQSISLPFCILPLFHCSHFDSSSFPSLTLLSAYYPALLTWNSMTWKHVCFLCIHVL